MYKNYFSPGWCGSVDWMLACEPKGRQFNSQSGHMPELGAKVPSWGYEKHNQSVCLSHIDISLPLFLTPFHSL